MSSPRRRRRHGRQMAWPLTLLLAALLCVPAAYLLAGGRLPWHRPAKRTGGAAPRGQTYTVGIWTPGDKQGFGTAYTYEDSLGVPPSRVWFTLQGGALSELYYPNLDTPQIRQVRFLVGDGKTWAADVTRDASHLVQRPDPRSLFFELADTDPKGRYTLMQEVLTDPDHESVAVRVRFSATDPALHLYLVLDPHVGGTGAANTLRYELPAPAPALPPYAGGAAIAEGNGYAAALATGVPWRAFTATFQGPQDAIHTLLDRYRFPTEYDIAAGGRVAGLIDLGAPAQPFVFAVGFGKTAGSAVAQARATLATSWTKLLERYRGGWHFYLEHHVTPLGGKETPLYHASIMVLKAAEDKTRRGAIVAAPAVPWGDTAPDRPESHGYRAVWPRDLYQAATALWLAGDRQTARAALDFLARLQKPDGSFPQNATLAGEPWWTGLQMDEVADPIILAWRLDAFDLYASLVRPAARFLLEHGPATPQERWEESSGYSPATIASEIAALTLAAVMADKAGDSAFAQDLRLAADRWSADLESQTYTRTGPLAGHEYYLRIAPDGAPDAATRVNLANGAGLHDQRQVVDPSFLELVRLGVRGAADPHILATLRAVDTLKVLTPAGPSWHRYSYDRYGDAGQGSSERQGRLWILLTGERGIYELAAGHAGEARSLQQAMERMAGGGDMLAEQVWEATGQGTESATPLIWSHAEYVDLFLANLRGGIQDRPAPVYERYGKAR